MASYTGNPYGNLPEVPQSLSPEDVEKYLKELREATQLQLDAMWECIAKIGSTNPNSQGGAKVFFNEDPPTGPLENGQTWIDTGAGAGIFGVYNDGSWSQVALL